MCSDGVGLWGGGRTSRVGSLQSRGLSASAFWGGCCGVKAGRGPAGCTAAGLVGFGRAPAREGWRSGGAAAGCAAPRGGGRWRGVRGSNRVCWARRGWVYREAARAQRGPSSGYSVRGFGVVFRPQEALGRAGLLRRRICMLLVLRRKQRAEPSRVLRQRAWRRRCGGAAWLGLLLQVGRVQQPRLLLRRQRRRARQRAQRWRQSEPAVEPRQLLEQRRCRLPRRHAGLQGTRGGGEAGLGRVGESLAVETSLQYGTAVPPCCTQFWRATHSRGAERHRATAPGSLVTAGWGASLGPPEPPPGTPARWRRRSSAGRRGRAATGGGGGGCRRRRFGRSARCSRRPRPLPLPRRRHARREASWRRAWVRAPTAAGCSWRGMSLHTGLCAPVMLSRGLLKTWAGQGGRGKGGDGGGPTALDCQGQAAPWGLEPPVGGWCVAGRRAAGRGREVLSRAHNAS